MRIYGNVCPFLLMCLNSAILFLKLNGKTGAPAVSYAVFSVVGIFDTDRTGQRLLDAPAV
jgi:hypothetical protein